GTPIGSGSIALQAFGFAQINDVFQSVGIDSTLENASLEFSATHRVFAYASVVDNDSGDAVYVSPFADEGTSSGSNAAPNGTITAPASDVTIVVGNEVFFAGSAADPDGDAVFVEWNFADGDTSDALVPGDHVFATEGVFNVSFTATDEHGLPDPTPASVVVTATTGAATPDPDLGDLFERIDLEPHIHDPSRIIEQDDGWRLVAVTGKAQEDGYDCGLETWFQEPGSNTWTPGQCILRDKPDWVAEHLPGNDGAYWAPALVDANTIIYSVSDFEDEGACIGLARATGQIPEQSWRDVGEPLSCTLNDSLGAPDRPHSIDPAYLDGPYGTPYLVYGGGNIWSAELAPGTLLIADGSWWEGANDVHHRLASGPDEPDEDGNDWIEAPFLFAREGSYYLFVNWYACCAGIDSTYEIRVGRASAPTGPFLDRDGVDM
ncbi:MAG: family 43 glycosylhydrolase, partial [bacterium]|nr:family 43 glycosylhydrolase [bacterium]